jgi:2,4-dienoyl-CoA reductase-like NADH-dependent reductase (Old Yellow Enzyme family)
MILGVAVLGFYLVDNFQYDGYYRNLVWTQSNAEVQKLQDQLTEWWHDHWGKHGTRSRDSTICSATMAPAMSPPQAAPSKHLATWRQVLRWRHSAGRCFSFELGHVGKRSQRRDGWDFQRPG